MNKKLNCIMLIDDDDATNYLHKLVIKRLDCASHVITAQNGIEALRYFESIEEDESNPKPDLIFLDINMPAMNGWEFLEEYHRLAKEKRNSIVIMMLTASLNPDDMAKAKTIPELDGFRNKPLTAEILQNILEEYFEDIDNQ